ncbi:MAG: DUF3365 domain-containing protein [Gammaproteobacteria bacterium]|jgi:hypothetical protein|nr:DUF3365 domain-containing protein [Gammaproteobacteria bacterium]
MKQANPIDCRQSRRLPGRIAVPTLVAAALLAAAGVRAGESGESAGGAEILAPFKRDLQAALQAGMQTGVVEAVTVCQLQAPAIAEAFQREGVRVGRASHKLRNPANAAPAWVQPILDEYLTAAAERAPRTVTLPGERAGYVEPIVLQPLCTACHGTGIATEVAQRISELYPDDEAVGFAPGDLRGVFWAEYPADGG